MMLPEHVKLLRDWTKEDRYDPKRELDEQMLENMNETISEAMEYGKVVAISHYHYKNYELVIGNIHFWDEINQKLHVIDRFEEVHRISISDIADVRFTD